MENFETQLRVWSRAKKDINWMVLLSFSHLVDGASVVLLRNLTSHPLKWFVTSQDLI
jgi:hypothetical protein